MSLPTGLGAQFGFKAESVYGTAVTVDRFEEFNNEKIATDFGRVVSRGLGRGAFPLTGRYKAFTRGAMGAIELDVMNKNFGLLFEHSIGQNTVTGSGANKTHTIIPAAAGLAGKSLTVQIGKPGVGGTIRPMTFEGGKVKTWELSAAVDEQLKLSLDMDFENVATATALASASYVSTQEMFIFTEGAVTIDGTTVFAKNVSIKGDNKLAVDRRFIGGTKKEPLQSDVCDISGSLTLEWDDFTFYSKALAGTLGKIVVTFTLATVIPTTVVPYSLTVTLENVDFPEVKPTVDGPGILTQELPFTAKYDGTNPVIKLEYVTADTAS